MSRLRVFMVILLIFALPSVLHAVGMGGMGGMGMGMGGDGQMGGMVNKISIQTKTVGKVVFTHSIHGTRCNECHPKLFQKKNNSNHVTMSAMEKGKSCGACHNGKRAFSVSGNCITCHTDAADILFKEEEMGNVTFSHSNHTEMFGCDSCHPDLFKAKRGANKATMADMENGESCGACHDGSAAFSVAEDCESCHQM